MKSKGSAFSALKGLLNANFLLTDTVIKRKEIIAYFNQRGANHLKHFYIENSTLDNYVNYLAKAGFIEKIGRGVYEIKMEIPKDVTVSSLISKIYDK